jgi:hypothetical protein
VEDRAMGMFMAHYVFGKSKSFEYLGLSFASTYMDEHLLACISAVGLVELASQSKSSDLLRMALERYSASLRLTNLALQSQTEATKDSTLLAILLLDLFEKITVIHSRRSISSITEHINGAAKLLELRGSKQFDSSSGFSLFMQCISVLMESCVQCKVRVPKEIIALLKHARNISDPTDYNWLVLEAFEDFTALRANISAGVFSDPRDIIVEAQRQDENCARLCMIFRSKWCYTTVFTNDTELAYEGIYHVYTASFLSVRTWNSIRIGRIMINEIIRDQFVFGSSTTPPLLNLAEYIVQFRAAGDTITEMTFEICGCIPQYSAAIPSSSPANKPGDQMLASRSTLSKVSSTSDTGDRNYTYSEEASAYSLIFSLFVIGRTTERPLKLHLWAIDRLQHIGNTIGLLDAIKVANLLKQKNDIDPWSVQAMLGGYNGQKGE